VSDIICLRYNISVTHRQEHRPSAENVSQLIEVYAQTFVLRRDCYALQLPDGSYRTLYEPLTTELITQHISGKITLGAYALNTDSQASWLCLDADIDEAQELPAKVLEGLRGYLNFETDSEKILLFALPKITRKLAYAQTLRNRLVRTELKAMTRSEMADMLRWRFTQAGGTVFPFENEALEYLYNITHGHPRTACGLAQLALEVAALHSGSITRTIVEGVKEKRFLE
jgi:hypothetical protein